MRPFGHTETREGREECIAPLDDRLQEVWEEFITPREWDGFGEDEINYSSFACALELLAPLRPSIDALHAHALRVHDDTALSDVSLGSFITAGYQLLPQKDIVYDLHLPGIYHLGAFLVGKRLTIAGAAGEHTGRGLIGELVVMGETSHHAGHGMFGVLRNHGTLGGYAGDRMTGLFENHGTTDVMAGLLMRGILMNHGTVDDNAGLMMLGKTNLPIPPLSRRYTIFNFLYDLSTGRKNPARCMERFIDDVWRMAPPYAESYDYLKKRYGAA
jgi:hypothetical protein